MTDETRWWPEHSDGLAPLRLGDICYAVLGPSLTHRLVTALEDTENQEITDEAVIRFRESLRHADGRPPTFLILLACAMALVERDFHIAFTDDASDIDDRHQRLRGRDLSVETYKHLGWLTVEAIRQFGWNEETFLDYCRRCHPWNLPWPPPGIAYSTIPPEAQPRRMKARDRKLWPDFWDHPTLIGAHLEGSGSLRAYIERLELGLEYAPIDLAERHWKSPRDPAEEAESLGILQAAVEQVRRAELLIRDAQSAICGVFPT